MEELVLHSFETRIIALLYIRLQKRDIDIENEDTINDYIRHLTIDDYVSLVNEVYAEAFSKDVQQPSKAKEAAKNDMEKAKKDAKKRNKRNKTMRATQLNSKANVTESQSSAPPSAPAAIPNVNGLSTSTETNVQSAPPLRYRLMKSF